MTPEATPRAVVEFIDNLDDKGLAEIADLLNYTAAMGLYEQLKRRLLEDGAPIQTNFEDESV